MRQKGRKFQKNIERKTNVFPRKTAEIVWNNYKNQIKMRKNRKNTDRFVKMTKIGIEILKPFVYNVFVAASNPKAA